MDSSCMSLRAEVIAGKVRDAVFNGIDELGLIYPYVDPLHWDKVGVLSTEGQSFGENAKGR